MFTEPGIHTHRKQKIYPPEQTSSVHRFSTKELCSIRFRKGHSQSGCRNDCNGAKGSPTPKTDPVKRFFQANTKFSSEKKQKTSPAAHPCTAGLTFTYFFQNEISHWHKRRAKPRLTLSKHAAYPFDSGYKRIYFFFGVIQSERSPDCSFYAQPLHQWLCTVMPGADGNPETVERSEEHTSELQSRQYLVCRLLLEKKKV